MLPLITKIFALLSKREKWMSLVLLVIMFATGLLTVLMLLSAVPFFYLISDPSAIDTNGYILQFKEITQSTNNVNTLYLLCGIAVVMTLLATAGNIVRTYAVARFAHMRAVSLTGQIFQQQMHQPYERFMELTPAMFIRQSVNEPTEVINGFLLPFTRLLASAITAVMMTALLAWNDPIITVGVIGFFLIGYGAVSRFVKVRLRALGTQRVHTATKRQSVIQEVIRCFRDIRMSGEENGFTERFQERSKEFSRVLIQIEVLTQFPRFWIQALFFFTIVIASTVLIIHQSTGQTTLLNLIPTLGLFAITGQRLLPEIQNIFQSWNTMTTSRAAVEDLFAAQEELRKIHTIHTNATPLGFAQQITLDNITYAYPDGSKAIADPLSLTIPKGQHIGIVGTSGSGKSTLVGILMGLLIPKTGAIRVDNIEMDAHRLVSWRKMIAQVPQDVSVLDASLKENIALGKTYKSIVDERVWDVLEICQLKEWASSLQEKLDTNMMQGTTKLSGGQKQRLGIARALYNQADIIVLDEATSALDTTTEEEILKTFHTHFHTKTIISIAHRLSTLQNCDRIIAMENGKLTFDGTWIEYMKKESDNV